MPPARLQAISTLGQPSDALQAEMVLPVRIELTTSALPRMRSTTELRQHFLEVARLSPAAAPPVNLLAGSLRRRHLVVAMTKDKDREERLAAALRENLRRRKAQTRKVSGEANEKKLES